MVIEAGLLLASVKSVVSKVLILVILLLKLVVAVSELKPCTGLLISNTGMVCT